jgi:hypothetical protein
MTATAARERWIFDQLNSSLQWLGDLTPFVDDASPAEVDHDATRAVRRTLKMRVAGNAPLTPLHDLIRPHYQLLMPDGGYVDFVLGTFALLPSGKTVTEGATWIDIQGADVSQLLADAGFLVSTGLPAGTGVIAGLQSLIASYSGLTPIPVRIIDPGTLLPASIGWEYGNNPLKAANDLLAALNFMSAAADELGSLYSYPIPDWNTASPVFTIDMTAGAGHMVTTPIVEQPDFSKAFNVALVLIEDPRRPTISCAVFNSRSDSPISTVNWHTKTQVIRDSRVIDLTTAQAVGLSALQEAARVYSPLVINTLPWPASQDQDVYRLVYSTPDEGLVAANFIETRWTHRCKAGAATTHTLAKVVPAGPA